MKWISWLLMCVFLAGCGTAPTTPVPTRTFLPLVLLTETPIPIKSPTATNTATTLPSLPTLTRSAALQPTLQPLPTYSAYGSKEKIQQMLINNGGCRLPCFWGITLGKTTINEFQQFVNQFPENAKALSRDPGFYTFYYDSPLHVNAQLSVIFFDDGSIIHGVGIKGDSAYLSFPLTRLLKEYGMPDKVMVGESNLFVLYEEQRIVGQYELSFDQPGYLCLDPKHVVGLMTWADGRDWLSYVNQLSGSDTPVVSMSSLQPIDQVTKYSMDNFYKQFSTKNRATCMGKLEKNP